MSIAVKAGSLHSEQLKVEHVINMYPRRRGDAERATLEELIKNIQTAAFPGYAYAAVEASTNKVIAIGGVKDLYNGVGYLWIVGTKDLERLGKDFTVFSKRMFKQVIDTSEYYRIVADVLVEKPEWKKWAEFIGFKTEGLARKYNFYRQDCYLLAWIREE